VAANPKTYRRPSAPFTDYDADTYNKNSQQVQHLVNRICNLLGVPNKAARTINGIRGMLNGIDQKKFPVYRAHQFVARQMDYKGQNDGADTFMCRALAALNDAEIKCGRRFFRITRADGVKQKMTSYDEDYLSTAIKWALVQVKNAPDYWENPAKAVTDEILTEAIEKFLPVRSQEKPIASDSDGDTSINGEPSITDDNVIKAQWTRLISLADANLDRIIAAGGDPLREVEKFCERMRSAALTKHFQMRLAEERERKERLRALCDTGESDETAAKGKDTGISSEESNPLSALSDALPHQTDGVVCDLSRDKAPIFETNEQAALWWASLGVPVFPLHTPQPDGSCSCPCGRRCKKTGEHVCGTNCLNIGKHPRTYHGLKEATTDAKQIKQWWRKWPDANIGGVTGEVSGIVGMDVDPKHGGDLSLTDLIEVYGDEWLDTFHTKTGSGGFHFLFKFPLGSNLRNTTNKLAPGIDTRADDSYLVLAPSLHFSGNRYEVLEAGELHDMPAWMLEKLTTVKPQAANTVVDFQERRQHARGGSIPEGQRNRRIFEIASGIWGSGSASDLPDLQNQLLEINTRRCNPPLNAAEVFAIASSVAGRYARGTGVSEEAKPDDSSPE
jgi:putative DNA primase/helicase